VSLILLCMPFYYAFSVILLYIHFYKCTTILVKNSINTFVKNRERIDG
jgi:hypothetical protein